MSEEKVKRSFFKTASFGKRMEFQIMAQMLQEGLDIYRPLVDDKGIDCLLRREDGSIAEIQVKARSDEIGAGNAGLFANIDCAPRPQYWYVLYAAKVGERGTMWILNSQEFAALASQNRKGKHVGTYNLTLHSKKKNEQGEEIAIPRPQFEKFIATDFSRIVKNEVELAG